MKKTAKHTVLALACAGVVTFCELLLVGAFNGSPQRQPRRPVQPQAPVIVAPTPPDEPQRIAAAERTDKRTPTRTPTSTPAPMIPQPLPPAAAVHAPVLDAGSLLASLGGAASLELPSTPEPDRPPRARRTPVATYPEQARRGGIEGYVVVRMRIDALGQVSDVFVLDAEPTGIFERSAREAAKRYAFEPARAGGVAVATTVEQRIVFRLR